MTRENFIFWSLKSFIKFPTLQISSGRWFFQKNPFDHFHAENSFFSLNSAKIVEDLQLSWCFFFILKFTRTEETNCRCLPFISLKFTSLKFSNIFPSCLHLIIFFGHRRSELLSRSDWLWVEKNPFHIKRSAHVSGQFIFTLISLTWLTRPGANSMNKKKPKVFRKK